MLLIYADWKSEVTKSHAHDSQVSGDIAAFEFIALFRSICMTGLLPHTTKNFGTHQIVSTVSRV